MHHVPHRELGYAVRLIVFLAALYVGAYYAIVTSGPEGLSRYLVEYRIGGNWAESFFAPMHELDLTIRPSWWQGGRVSTK